MIRPKHRQPNRTTFAHRLLLTIHLTFLCFGLFGTVVGNATALATTDLTYRALGTTQSATAKSATAKPTTAQTNGNRLIYVLTFAGMVTPVLDQYLQDNIAAAHRDGAELIILQLDTPGGRIDLTNAITQKMLASPVPIVVYVAPAAARAGSAGTFLTLAAHVAAMAPGSSIGAASPVGAGGEDIGETMEAKVKNILSADIENLAARRGDQAVEWAIAAVQDAAAATADQALAMGVIDFVAADLADLFEQLNGFVVTVRGEERTLQTDNPIITDHPLSGLQKFLNFLTDPTVASLLMAVGSAGLVAEVWNPGTWIPGVAGAICLVLGLYALGQLDANFAGLALMVVALGLFIAEAFTPTFGALAVAGAIAFVLGGALLFDTPGLETPWVTILSLAITMGLFTVFAGAKGLASQKRPTITGSEGLIGQHAQVRAGFAAGESGRVFVDGEWWHATLWTLSTPADAAAVESTASVAVHKGDKVEIVARNGYTLVVKPLRPTG